MRMIMTSDDSCKSSNNGGYNDDNNDSSNNSNGDLSNSNYRILFKHTIFHRGLSSMISNIESKLLKYFYDQYCNIRTTKITGKNLVLHKRNSMSNM